MASNSTFAVCTSMTIFGILVYLLLANDALGISIRSPSATTKFKVNKYLAKIIDRGPQV